jgi:hypothetical protein
VVPRKSISHRDALPWKRPSGSMNEREVLVELATKTLSWLRVTLHQEGYGVVVVSLGESVAYLLH